MTTTAPTVESLSTLIEENQNLTNTSIDAGWTILAGILVFFMHAGFALLESGTVRFKNTQNILIKNVITTCVGALTWYAVGYGLAFGKTQDGYLGTDGFFMNHDNLKTKDGGFLYAFWFFQFTFCATAATIVSGALAERCKLEGYLIFTIILTSVIYPIVVHWTWGGGWLTEAGYQDFAGSGVVHMVGGISGLWGALILGPRIGKFDASTKESEFYPVSLGNVCLGTLILWFGWFGFNAGSTTAISGSSAEVAGHCAVTTTLSAACGGITAFILFSLKSKKYDAVAFANGILAGLVGITAGTNNIDTHFSCFIGLISGILLFGVDNLLNFMGESKLFTAKRYNIQSGCEEDTPVGIQIDDPLGAFAVHGVCGIWGVLAVGLFDLDNGIAYGNAADKVLVPNLLGIGAIISWVSLCSIPIFLALKFGHLLRVPAVAEIKGLDAKNKQSLVGYSDKDSEISNVAIIKEAEISNGERNAGSQISNLMPNEAEISNGERNEGSQISNGMPVKQPESV